jgi:hypothetical protein
MVGPSDSTPPVNFNALFDKVPADFPRPVHAGAVSGFQNKLLLVEYEGKLYESGPPLKHVRGPRNQAPRKSPRIQHCKALASVHVRHPRTVPAATYCNRLDARSGGPLDYAGHGWPECRVGRGRALCWNRRRQARLNGTTSNAGC